MSVYCISRFVFYLFHYSYAMYFLLKASYKYTDHMVTNNNHMKELLKFIQLLKYLLHQLIR